MHPHIERILFTAEQIAARTRALGKRIAEDLAASAAKAGEDARAGEQAAAPAQSAAAQGGVPAQSAAAQGGVPAQNPAMPLAVCILKGSVPFFADLIRAIPLPLETEYIALSSYGAGTASSGTVHIGKDIEADVAGRDVLIVEDIVDSGRTLAFLCGHLAARRPRSVRVVTLLDKPSRRAVPFSPDYVGFAVDDVFVVGCGMDYAGRYRNLPYIGVLKPSVYGD